MYHYTVVFELGRHPYGSILGARTDPRTSKTFTHEKVPAKDDDEARELAKKRAEYLAVGNVSCKVLRIIKERHEIPVEKPGLDEKGH